MLENPTFELLARLGAAILIGAVIGLNRQLKHKPAGLRTHALVSLGAATITALITWDGGAGSGNSGGFAHYDALSRVVQGIITGIGFLGAGVIMRGESRLTVHGLTTAASIWLAACLGAACGAGAWLIALITFALVMAILLLGGPTERAALRRFKPRGGATGGGAGEEEDETEREARQR